jgi:hypothetical protein
VGTKARYLLRHPTGRLVIETPQYFMLRVACGLSRTAAEAIGFYRLMSSLGYLPSSPTLFNSGTSHPQMSSCFLVDSPRDDLGSIYDRYSQVARLSKFSGGIGIGWSRVRSRGALIRGTNGASNGIVPFLKTLDASVAAVNQGGRRKGAACVYTSPTGGSPSSASSRFTARPTRSPSCTCKTCRSCPTSSSAGSPLTRSASPGRSPSTTTFKVLAGALGRALARQPPYISVLTGHTADALSKMGDR